ncbi:hypothetical protein D3C76_1797780 [compost metagenome]
MKMIGIYIVLAFLTAGMIVAVDLISGTSLATSLRSFIVVFATTTLQETFCMIVFAVLPVILAVSDKLKSGRSSRN